MEEDLKKAPGKEVKVAQLAILKEVGEQSGQDTVEFIIHEFDPAVAEHAVALEQQLMKIVPVDALKMRHSRVAKASSCPMRRFMRLS